MRILFVTWAGGGNSTPVVGLATRLKARGHDVVVASPDDMTARFAEVGIDYEVFDRRPGSVLEVIERFEPALNVVDFMMPSWLNQAEASGIPSVALVHTLYDRIAVGILTAFTNLDAINEERQALGLDALGDANELLDRAARVLVTGPRELETPADVGANVSFVGAILEEASADAAWEPATTDRPLVVISLGTTPGLDEAPVVGRVLDAVSELPVHAVANLSPYVDPASLELPANALVLPYVRHAAVLPWASVLVNHGGLGSTIAALSFGVPVVAIALDRDQPHNAAQIEAAGVGIALSRGASVEQIRDAIDRALHDPTLRDATAPFVAQYDATASRAISELEALG